jgi:hypothetical protein
VHARQVLFSLSFSSSLHTIAALSSPTVPVSARACTSASFALLSLPFNQKLSFLILVAISSALRARPWMISRPARRQPMLAYIAPSQCAMGRRPNCSACTAYAHSTLPHFVVTPASRYRLCGVARPTRARAMSGPPTALLSSYNHSMQPTVLRSPVVLVTGTSGQRGYL